MHRYAEIPLPATGIPNAFKIKGWTITTVRSPILSSAEIDDATDKLKIPMPEMVFGNNYLELSYSPGSVTDATEPSLNENKDVQSENVQWSLRFDTYGALDRVDKTGERLEGGLLQVAHSKKWLQSTERTVKECPDEIQGIVRPYDWTYTTDYKGEESYKGPENKDPSSGKKTNPYALTEVTPEQGELYEKRAIPFEKLKIQESIHYFDQAVLFEDELGDNGIAAYYVKVRVMSSRLLILARLFLRVDGVIFRVRDTRVYVEFKYEGTMTPGGPEGVDSEDKKNIGEPYVIREYTEHEASYEEVRKLVPRGSRDFSMFLRDKDWVASQIPVKKRLREFCFLPKYQGPDDEHVLKDPLPGSQRVESKTQGTKKPVVNSPRNGSTSKPHPVSSSEAPRPSPRNANPGATSPTPGTTNIPSSLLLPVPGSRIPPGATSNITRQPQSGPSLKR